jgi:hypothetical protein
MYRQGDVLVIPVRSIPKSATPRKREAGRVILAHGEVTGHAHAIDDTTHAPTAQLLDAPDGLAYLKVDEISRLVHQEHGSIELAPGRYKVIRQREYTPEAIRTVAD